MTLSVKDASGTTQTIKTNDDMAGVAGTPNTNVLSVQGIAGATALPVSVANLPATQAVTAAALPLPSGAATDATLGTIGTSPPTLPGASSGILGMLRYQATLLTNGAGSAAAAQRVVVASDQTAIPAYRPGTAYTDRSGTITAGGTAQVLAAANAARRGWRLYNASASDLWFNDKGATATVGQPSVKLPAGGYYESPAWGASTAAISIIGATTAQAFEAAEG